MPEAEQPDAALQIGATALFNAGFLGPTGPVTVESSAVCRQETIAVFDDHDECEQCHAMIPRGPVIDVEATVTRLSPPEHAAEFDLAQQLAMKVLEERQVWINAWREQIVNPENARLNEYPLGTMGCDPGSCEIRVGERVIAKFVVRFSVEDCAAQVSAEWPLRKWDEPSFEERAGKHCVVYEQMPDRVCWACGELDLEVTADTADALRALWAAVLV